MSDDPQLTSENSMRSALAKLPSNVLPATAPAQDELPTSDPPQPSQILPLVQLPPPSIPLPQLAPLPAAEDCRNAPHADQPLPSIDPTTSTDVPSPPTTITPPATATAPAPTKPSDPNRIVNQNGEVVDLFHVCYICKLPPKRPTDSYRIAQPDVVQYCFALTQLPTFSHRLCARHYHLLRLHNQNRTKLFPFEYARNILDRKRISCTTVHGIVPVITEQPDGTSLATIHIPQQIRVALRGGVVYESSYEDLKSIDNSNMDQDTWTTVIEATMSGIPLRLIPSAQPSGANCLQIPPFVIDEETPHPPAKRGKKSKAKGKSASKSKQALHDDDNEDDDEEEDGVKVKKQRLPPVPAHLPPGDYITSHAQIPAPPATREHGNSIHHYNFDQSSKQPFVDDALVAASTITTRSAAASQYVPLPIAAPTQLSQPRPKLKPTPKPAAANTKAQKKKELEQSRADQHNQGGCEYTALPSGQMLQGYPPQGVPSDQAHLYASQHPGQYYQYPPYPGIQGQYPPHTQYQQPYQTSQATYSYFPNVQNGGNLPLSGSQHGLPNFHNPNPPPLTPYQQQQQQQQQAQQQTNQTYPGSQILYPQQQQQPPMPPGYQVQQISLQTPGGTQQQQQQQQQLQQNRPLLTSFTTNTSAMQSTPMYMLPSVTNHTSITTPTAQHALNTPSSNRPQPPSSLPRGTQPLLQLNTSLNPQPGQLNQFGSLSAQNSLSQHQSQQQRNTPTISSLFSGGGFGGVVSNSSLSQQPNSSTTSHQPLQPHNLPVANSMQNIQSTPQNQQFYPSYIQPSNSTLTTPAPFGSAPQQHLHQGDSSASVNQPSHIPSFLPSVQFSLSPNPILPLKAHSNSTPNHHLLSHQNALVMKASPAPLFPSITTGMSQTTPGLTIGQKPLTQPFSTQKQYPGAILSISSQTTAPFTPPLQLPGLNQQQLGSFHPK